MNIIYKAIAFAAHRHSNQMYGDKPYWHHLMQVNEVLGRHLPNGLSLEDETLPLEYHEAFSSWYEAMQVASWLHDIVEDTKTSLEEIHQEFGSDVANYVNAVTGIGKNRKERNQNVYDKLAAFPEAIPLKLADRIANVKNCIATNPDLLKMYKKEYVAFRAALYPKMGFSHLQPFYKNMWDELDSLLK